MSENNHPTLEEPMVECDFSGVSRQWALEWAEVNVEIQALTMVFNSDSEIDPNEIMAHVKSSAQLARRRNDLLAQVIVGVPSSWLVKNAPAEIDWSVPENLLQYVRGDRDDDLVTAVTLARASAAKNSQGTTSTA
jgi:hypothetical protein